MTTRPVGNHRRHCHPRFGAPGERGSLTVELVLLAPVFLALLAFVVGLGRLAETRGQVTGAARDAARAASLTRTPADATRAAEQTARTDLRGAGITCAGLHVNTDTDTFTAGGIVRVHVACTTDLADVTISGLPGAHTFTGTAAAPLDSYTGLQP